MLPDSLTRLQRDLAAYLSLDPELADVHVFQQRTDVDTDGRGVVDDMIEDALAGVTPKNGKSGVAIVVLMPDAAPIDPNLPGPQIDLEIGVRVIENRIINEGAGGVGLSAPQLALHLCRLLHHYCLDGSNVLRPAQKLIEDISTPDREAHQVNFLLRFGVAPLTRLTQPVLSGVQGPEDVTVTITGPSGASVFYSIDGSFPSLPYTTPLVLSSTTTVRAIAVATGALPSRVEEAYIVPA